MEPSARSARQSLTSSARSTQSLFCSPVTHTGPSLALFSHLPLRVQNFRLYLPPGRRVPLFLSQSRLVQAACHPRPLPCWLPVVSRPTGLAVLGNSSRFLEKTTGAREKGPQSPQAPALPRAWGSPARGRKPCGFWLLPGGLRICPPPPSPGPKAQILFRRRSRWRREEAQVERSFQGSQAWGFLSPGSGLRLPHWGPQVA